MSKVIILSEVLALNERIREEIKVYEKQLQKCEMRMSILRQERQQLVTLLEILEGELNDGQ